MSSYHWLSVSHFVLAYMHKIRLLMPFKIHLFAPCRLVCVELLLCLMCWKYLKYSCIISLLISAYILKMHLFFSPLVDISVRDFFFFLILLNIQGEMVQAKICHINKRLRIHMCSLSTRHHKTEEYATMGFYS